MTLTLPLTYPINQIKSSTEAINLLIELGTPPRLITHLKLVSEAADELISFLQTLKLDVDYQFITTGAALPDAGKIIHQNELKEKGNQHEPDGEELLLENNVSSSLARVCLSHARYNEMEWNV